MNLTSLFNFQYLKENIKKSRAVILLMIFLIPVINVIYYLMNSSNSNYIIPSILELQPLSLVGMYILPVILSITLFSFIYKRKSSDFVMSFPVSKKQIFISNTIGGIIVILAMNIVNYLFTLIATLLLNNILIDYTMLFDMLIMWTISYIFVFTCTNIAVSVSSNKITTVVVTLLILFLMPFVHTFITSETFKGIDNSDIYTYCDNEICKPTNYKCYSTACEVNKRKNLYIYTSYNEIESTTNYTIPYAILYGSVVEDIPSINKSITKMFILSIVYIIIGLLLFIRKKFEIVETSFKSEKTHIIVRSLTTIPIICIYYIMLINSNITFSDVFTVTFLVVLLITYIIIYDLITRKKITNIFKSLIALMIVGILVVVTGELSTPKKIEQLAVNNIDKMTFMDSNMVNNNGYTKDKDLINYIISIHIDNIKGEENYYRNFNVRINVDKKIYEFRISTTKEQYNHIIDTLSKDSTYQKSSGKIKNNAIFAIQLNGDRSYITKDNELYNKVIETFKKSTTIKNEISNSLFTAEISTYDNFKVNRLYYDITNIKLQEEILNYYNSEVVKTFEDSDIEIHTYYIGKYNEEENTVYEDYLSSYYQNENIEINNFILDNMSKKVDITKPYMYIRFYTNNYNKNVNIFVTNKVEELELLIEKVKEQEENIEIYDMGDNYDKYTY